MFYISAPNASNKKYMPSFVIALYTKLKLKLDKTFTAQTFRKKKKDDLQKHTIQF